MSLFGAMNTAISGLTAQSAAFTNIGDNVANSQTVGYKRIDTSFEDYLTTSTAARSDSGSVVAAPDYVNDVQGTITQSDSPLSLAVNGNGFFQVSAASGQTNGLTTFSPQQRYTREGDFTLNKSGYIVNASGNYLDGWTVDPVTGVNSTTVAPIQVSQAAYSPVPTSTVTLAANLPATPDGTAIQPQIQVYDALGTPHVVEMNWTQVTGSPNTWSVSLNSPDATTPALGTATVTFGAPSGTAAPAGTVGTIVPSSGMLTGSSYIAGQSATLGFSADYGSGPQAITLNLGTFGQANGLTQFAGTAYSLGSLTQDGVPPGSFSGVTAKTDGSIVANYDNGQSRTVARVPLTTFAAPDALQRQNGQAFTATLASGAPQTKAAGTGGTQGMSVQSLESSNVDIAQEFTKLIVAQRAYSANTKVVTTADDLLQQTIDMKR